MELKVGMYVRLKQGYIGKIININEFREQKYCVDIQASDYVFVDGEDIIKSSPNILEIIEVGDYVNGFEVDNDGMGLLINHNDTYDYIKDFEIKSICTKENFEGGLYYVK